MLLVKRAVIRMLKRPFALMSGLGMSLFFLLVYNAGIGGIGHLPEFGGGGYLSFLLPMSLVSLAMGSAAGAGVSLHSDISSGYFRRLFLSPAPRWIFAAAPLAADSVSTLIGASVILAAGAVSGVSFRYGLLSVLGVLALALLWSIFLSAFSAGVMLRTGSAEGAKIVTSAVFPLIFLSSTFLPLELITARWLLAVSMVNPVTYLMEGMRFLLAGTSSAGYFHGGLFITASLAAASLIFALTGTRRIPV